MKFLNYQENIQLQKILISKTILQTADVEFRSALFTNCGLGKYCSLISLDKPSYKLVPILCQKLSKDCLIIEGTPRLELVIFLEYISQIDFNLSDDDKKFINYVITKWEQQQKASIQKPQRNQISNLLTQGREESATSTSGQQAIKVDRGLIINYNLDKLMAAFRQEVGYEGAFVFAVAGEFAILEQYIIERIRRELKQKTGRENERLEIRLYRNSIATSADIERKFLEKHQIECFTDLFKTQYNPNKAQYNSDLVLIIWNYDIPPNLIKSLAQDFWTDIHCSVDPYLIGKSRCFVILWANLQGKRPLTGFPVLPTPKQFDPDDLLPWFRGQLQIVGIEEKGIEHYLNRLESQCGNLIGTYQEMNQIVRELQGSSKLYG